MKIAIFESLEVAQDRLNAYNALARHMTSPADFTLTEIYKHTVENFWWFNADDCVDNGGLNRDTIAADINNLTITEIDIEDLATEGYLPE